MPALRTLTPELLAFIEEMRVPGILSTLGLKGEPISSAVWYGIHNGDVVIATPAGRNKARNARNDPRVSFLVDTKERPYRGVAIEGVVTVEDDHELVVMESIARRYLGPELPEWIRERYTTSERVILRIRPLRVRAWNIEVPAGQT